MILPGRRVKRLRDGSFELRLSRQERAVLAGLPQQVADLLESDDPSVRRLFPPAYADDAGLEAEYRRLMGDDLLASHRQALAVMEETVRADRLDRDQLAAWLGALNDLRLVLGTRLNVSEDMSGVSADDPRAAELAVYGYLGWLQEQVVDALASEL